MKTSSLALLALVLVSCSITPPKDLELNPKVGDRTLKIRRLWDLSTRTALFRSEGNTPQELGGLSFSGDALVFGNLEGRFQAVDRFSGQTLWSTMLPDSVESRPLVHDKFIYVGSSDGWFFGLSVHGGRILWKVDLGAEVLGQPKVTGGMLFVHTVNGRIIAMDAQTGKWMWEVKRPQLRDKSIRNASSVLPFNGRLYVGTIDGTVLVLKPEDGTKIWEKSLTPGFRFTDVDTTPQISGKTIIVSAFDGKTYGLRMEDGAILWASDEGAAFDSVVEEDRVIVSTQAGTVQALDIASGKVLWKAEFDRREGIATGAAVSDGLVAFGTTGGSVYLVSLSDGHFVWSFRPGTGSTSTPQFRGENLYVLSNYGNLYAFSIQ